MFDELRLSYKRTTGRVLSLSDSEIEDAIRASTMLGADWEAAPLDRASLVREHIVYIVTCLLDLPEVGQEYPF